MKANLKTEVRPMAAGYVTAAGYTGPCGSPMAASFYGTLNDAQVRQILERYRKIDAQIAKVTS
jgi:hypothetical protein